MNMRALERILIIALIAVCKSLFAEPNQTNDQAHIKLHQLVNDLSGKEKKMLDIYRKYFEFHQGQEEIAESILSEIRETFGSESSGEVEITKLESHDYRSKVIIQAAIDYGITDVYQASTGNDKHKLFYGVRKNGKLILYIPLNEGRKGVVTL